MSPITSNPLRSNMKELITEKKTGRGMKRETGDEDSGGKKKHNDPMASTVSGTYRTTSSTIQPAHPPGWRYNRYRQSLPQYLIRHNYQSLNSPGKRMSV